MTSVIGVKRSGRTVNVEKDLALVGRTVEMFRSLPYECVPLHVTRGQITEHPT